MLGLGGKIPGLDMVFEDLCAGTTGASECSCTCTGCDGFVVLRSVASVEPRPLSIFAVVCATAFELCCPGAVPTGSGCVVGVVIGIAGASL